MWESPIQMITDDIIKDIVQKQDELIMEAVHRVGFNIDKYELMEALNYDRDQYEKGYADGRQARDSEIVRCKDCKHRDGEDGQCPLQTTGDPYLDTYPQNNFYCAYGERREDDAEVH